MSKPWDKCSDCERFTLSSCIRCGLPLCSDCANNAMLCADCIERDNAQIDAMEAMPEESDD